MDDASLRDWLAAALRSGRPPPLGETVSATQLLEAAEREGVTALLEARLRAEGGWAALTDDQRDALQSQARGLAAQWLLRADELRRIERVLAAAGLRVLLLKGAALSLWLYPQPFLRMGGDIDLLLASREESERAVQTVSAFGYELMFTPGDTHYEMTCRRIVNGVLRSELDLHCRLINAPSYADVLGFEELWDTSVALSGLAGSLRSLSPPHALLHACMNRALDMQNAIPDRLKLLYDLRLFAERMGSMEWEELLALAQTKGIAGVCLRSLEDAHDRLAADVPENVVAKLRAAAESESLDYSRLGDWRYMQWRHLRALPTWRARARWLLERLLPSRGQLRELHGEGGWWMLMLRRVRHGWSKLR